MKHSKLGLFFLTLICVLAGCSNDGNLTPSSEFTDEEKAAIVAEEAAIADEESGGGLPPVKGKKKKTRVKSDWETYYGSNKALQEEVKKNGPDEYVREVLHLCKSRSECSYWENWEIFTRHALMLESYYNEWTSVRVRKDHLIKL